MQTLPLLVSSTQLRASKWHMPPITGLITYNMGVQGTPARGTIQGRVIGLSLFIVALWSVNLQDRETFAFRDLWQEQISQGRQVQCSSQVGEQKGVVKGSTGLGETHRRGMGEPQ